MSVASNDMMIQRARKNMTGNLVSRKTTLKIDWILGDRGEVQTKTPFHRKNVTSYIVEQVAR
jgi:hypothetical protein